jgi:hypothetical protein
MVNLHVDLPFLPRKKKELKKGRKDEIILKKEQICIS